MNFQTFTQHNVFTRPHSLSVRQLQQLDCLKSSKSNRFLKASLRQIQKVDPTCQITNQYQNIILQESTNKIPKNRTPSISKFDDQYFAVNNRISKPVNSSQKNIQKNNLSHLSCKELLYLIKNQKQCINTVKQIVLTDKSKIQDNFIQFKQSINNVVDDLKLTIFAHLDNEYKHYVEQLNTIKSGYSKYCEIKNEFWKQNQGIMEKAQKKPNLLKITSYPGFINNGKNQNQSLLNNLFNDLKDCKIHQNYQQFQSIQQKILKPLLIAAKLMIKQLNIKSYYQPQNTNSLLNQLYKTIQTDVSKLNERIDLFLSCSHKITSEKIVHHQTRKKQNHKNQINRIEENIPITSMKLTQQSVKLSSKVKETYEQEQQLQNQITLKEIKKQKEEIVIGSEKQSIGTFDKKYNSTAQSSGSIKQSYKTLENKNQFNELKENIVKRSGSMTNFQLGSPQFNNNKKIKNQSISDKNTDTKIVSLECVPNISDKSTINNVKQSIEDQTAICLLLIKGNTQIAVGTKNGKIKIFCLKKGIKLSQLNGHKACVCSLAAVSSNNDSILASGGDKGCHQLILWDLHQNAQYHNFSNCHRSAITSIISLEDGKYVASGSFDRTINIYNYKNRQMTATVNSGEKITLLTTFTGKNSERYIISGHLSLQIAIWKVCKNNFNRIIGLQGIKKINIDTIPYSIFPLSSQSVVISGQDGKIKIIDIVNGITSIQNDIGQCYELIPVNGVNNSQNYHHVLLLGCLKDGKIVALQQQKNEIIVKYEMNNQNNLSYSCGISPKAQVNAGRLYIPNHNITQTEINIWQMQMKNTNQNRTEIKTSSRTL